MVSGDKCVKFPRFPLRGWNRWVGRINWADGSGGVRGCGLGSPGAFSTCQVAYRVGAEGEQKDRKTMGGEVNSPGRAKAACRHRFTHVWWSLEVIFGRSGFRHKLTENLSPATTGGRWSGSFSANTCITARLKRNATGGKFCFPASLNKRRDSWLLFLQGDNIARVVD